MAGPLNQERFPFKFYCLVENYIKNGLYRGGILLKGEIY